MAMFTDFLDALKQYLITFTTLTDSNIFFVPLPDKPDKALSIVITNWKRESTLKVGIAVVIEYRDVMSKIDSSKTPITTYMEYCDYVDNLINAPEGKSYGSQFAQAIKTGDNEIMLDNSSRYYCQMNYRFTLVDAFNDEDMTAHIPS